MSGLAWGPLDNITGVIPCHQAWIRYAIMDLCSLCPFFFQSITMILYFGALAGGFYLIAWLTAHQLDQKVVYKEVKASQACSSFCWGVIRAGPTTAYKQTSSSLNDRLFFEAEKKESKNVKRNLRKSENSKMKKKLTINVTIPYLAKWNIFYGFGNDFW